MFVLGLICQSKDGSKLAELDIRIFTLILLHLEDSLFDRVGVEASNVVRNSVFRIRKHESVYIENPTSRMSDQALPASLLSEVLPCHRLEP